MIRNTQVTAHKLTQPAAVTHSVFSHTHSFLNVQSPEHEFTLEVSHLSAQCCPSAHSPNNKSHRYSFSCFQLSVCRMNKKTQPVIIVNYTTCIPPVTLSTTHLWHLWKVLSSNRDLSKLILWRFDNKGKMSARSNKKAGWKVPQIISCSGLPFFFFPQIMRQAFCLDTSPDLSLETETG